MNMKTRGGKPKKLEDLEVDEVSIVDNPANRIRFALMKRNNPEEKPMSELAKLAAALKEPFTQFIAKIDEEAKALRKNDNDPMPSASDVFTKFGEETTKAVAEIRAEVVKVFGETVVKDDRFGVVKAALEAALKAEGLPEAAKTELDKAMEAIDGLTKDAGDPPAAAPKGDPEWTEEMLKAIAEKVRPGLETAISESITKALGEKFVEKSVFEDFMMATAAAIAPADEK